MDMNLRKFLVRFFASFSIALLGACDTEPEWVMRSHESEKYSFTRFLEKIEDFPYTADDPKLSRVREGFKRLSLGMQKSEIKDVMGEPDYEMLHYKLEQKREELIYSTWGYYLKRFERNLGKEDFDEAVVLYFKPNEKLYWADPGNLKGLKPLGGPDLHPDSIMPITR